MEKQYAKSLEGYAGKLLLVGFIYEKSTKKHQCAILEIWK